MKSQKILSWLSMSLLFFSGMKVAWSQTNFWQKTNGPYGGEITALAINNVSGDVFAGTRTRGGIYLSTDNGGSWTRIWDTQLVTALVINSNGHIFAGFVGRASRSIDNGKSWSTIFYASNNGTVECFAINTTTGHIFAGTSNDGIYRSTNNGDNWTSVNSGLTKADVRSLSINSSGHIFAGTFGGGVYRSIDNGNTWTQVNNGLMKNYILSLTINTTNGHIFAGTWGGGAYRSIDDGATWVPINTGLTHTFVTSLNINLNGHIFAGSEGGGVYHSVDNGDHWTQINFGLADTDIRSIAVNPIGHIFVGSFGGGVYRSTNNGQTWTHVSTDLINVSINSLAINSSGNIFAGTFHGGVYRYIDNGDTWKQTSLTTSHYGYTIAINNTNGYIFAGVLGDAIHSLSYGVNRSIDNGDSWMQMNIGIAYKNISGFAINSSGHIFAGDNGGDVFLSTNNGESWTQTGILPDAFYVNSLAINSLGHIFAGTSAGSNNGVYRSTDNGETWAPINTGLTDLYVNVIAISSDDQILAGTLRGGIYRSSDNGENWVQSSLITSIYAIVFNSIGHIFAGGFAGVFRSTDDGDTWKAINTGLMNERVSAFAIDLSGHIFAGTSNGIYRSIESTTSVDVRIPNLFKEPDSVVTIPLEVSDLPRSYVNSYQAEITFDENVLDALEVSSKGTLSEPLDTLIANLQIEGRISLVGSGTEPLNGRGTLVNLLFKVIGAPGQTTNLSFSAFMFNNGNPPTNTHGGIFTVEMPVPVELSSFSAMLIDNVVLLRWTTTTETNNLGFEIEKKSDKRSFKKQGFVSGYGTTSQNHEYEFYDNDIGPGVYYYRLKQIDTDGTFRHSETIQVEVKSPQDFALDQNFPNPFNANTIIEYELPEGTHVKMVIYDGSGQQVCALVDVNQPAGLHCIKWDGRNDRGLLVGSGIYYYKIKAGEFVKSRKMLLLR